MAQYTSQKLLERERWQLVSRRELVEGCSRRSVGDVETDAADEGIVGRIRGVGGGDQNAADFDKLFALGVGEGRCI